jgi:CRISPR system Cascade subunit CasA
VECPRYELHVFGFDVTNAKVRSWIDARVPAFAIQDEERLGEFGSVVTSLTEATELAAYTLQRNVVAALYGASDDPPGDLSFVKASLWSATESEFYTLVSDVLGAAEFFAAATDARRRFQEVLLRAAQEIFDGYVRSDDSQPEQLRRTVVARFDLVTTLAGGGKQGEKLFGILQLAMPKDKKTRTGRKRTTEQEVEA